MTLRREQGIAAATAADDDGARLRFVHWLRDTPGLRRPILLTLSFFRRIASAPAGVYTLCYHHVAAKHQASFRRQLAYLGRYGTFIDADRAVGLVRTGDARQRFFLASFDDGYADLVDVALPVLSDLRIPAIAFIVSSWPDARTNPSADRAAGFMSRADITTWRSAGMDVGSHSHTHRHMIELGDAEVLEELRRSAGVLADAAGMPVRHFACPWGVPGRDFRLDREPRLAAELGFASFFTTTRGVATGRSDPWLMPRDVLEPHWPLFELDALMGGLRL